MAAAMEPATPSSVMGDSEASGQLGGTEKDAGTIEIHNTGWDAGFLRPDLSDVLMAALYPMPKGYNPHPKNRHERRKNRALLRDGTRLSPFSFMRGPIAAPAVAGEALRIITEFRV